MFLFVVKHLLKVSNLYFTVILTNLNRYCTVVNRNIFFSHDTMTTFIVIPLTNKDSITIENVSRCVK